MVHIVYLTLLPNVAFWFSVFRGFKREHQEENSEKVFFDRTLFIDFPLNFFTQSWKRNKYFVQFLQIIFRRPLMWYWKYSSKKMLKHIKVVTFIAASNYIFKVNNRISNTRLGCEIYSKLSIKSVNFYHILHLVLLFMLFEQVNASAS